MIDSTYCLVGKRILHSHLGGENRINRLEFGQVGAHGRGVPVHLALGNQPTVTATAVNAFVSDPIMDRF